MILMTKTSSDPSFFLISSAFRLVGKFSRETWIIFIDIFSDI